MFFRWNNQWYKVSYIFCFFPQVERKNLLQKWLPYSDRFGVKKTFLVTLYNSSSKIYLYALLSTYLEGAFEKNLPSKWKKRSKPRLRGPFYTFPFSILLAASKPRFRTKTRTNIWCRDFHELRASYSNSIPEHRAGLGWSQNEIYGFLAVGKICTWK